MMHLYLHKQLDKLQDNLKQIQDQKFTNINIVDGRFEFEYLGGKFITFKKIKSNNPNQAELIFFHDTLIPNWELTEVENFNLLIDHRGQIRISHHLPESDYRFRFRPDDNGLINTYNDEEFPLIFSMQFDALMANIPFEIFIKGTPG